MSAKRVLPKVSGLVKAGALSDAQKESISNYLPFFDAPSTNFDKSLDTSQNTQQVIEQSEAQNTSGARGVPVTLLPIAKIQRSCFQNRTVIDEVYISDLAENIKTDGLNQPITVRPIDNEQYEVIAGEHRYEAYKLLKREKIPAIVRNLDDRQAARSLCYDNIFHKKLSDYEIFRGFQKLLELDQSLSLRGIAKDTGMSSSHVKRIMTFGKLPKECTEILDMSPTIIGANVSEVLAKHTTVGREDYVIKALKLIRDGKLTQMRAGAWIESRANPKPQKTNRVLTSKEGKHYCTLTRDKSRININVSYEVDITVLETSIYELLKQHAETKQSSASDDL